jgi:hypothetical protein
MASGFIAVGARGSICETRDSIGWWNLRLNQFVNLDLMSFFDISSTGSFAVACGQIGGSVSRIVHTTDGFNWSYANIPGHFAATQTTFSSIAATDTYCVCVGAEFGTNNFIILYSHDNGLNWTQASFTDIVANRNPRVYADGTRAIIAYIDETNFNMNALVSTNGGVTWTPGLFNTSAGAVTINDISGNSTQYFAVGFGDPANDTALIQTSPDGLTWTPQTPAYGLGYSFDAVWSTDALTVVGGSSDAFVAVINTSPTGAVWTSRSLPIINIESTPNIVLGNVDAIAKSDTRWAITGPDTYAGGGTQFTSTDGLTWVDNQLGDDSGPPGSQEELVAITPFDPLPPSALPLTGFAYDDSCHLYISPNAGATWYETHQDETTLLDDFPDMAMATNDGDYKTTLSFDVDYLFANTGRVFLSHDFGLCGTWNTINPDPVNNLPDLTKAVIWSGGAISTAGNIVLLCPMRVIGTPQKALYISRDGGLTYSNTGSARTWYGAAMGTNGVIQYANSLGQHISKSTDSGHTWSDLANSPISNAGGTNIEGDMRLRCTPDAQTVIFCRSINADPTFTSGTVWVSKDAGSTWTKVVDWGLLDTGESGQFTDGGVSDNGMVMITTNSDTTHKPRVSFNGGTTWSNITNSHTGTGGGFSNPVSCNVSPDGTSFIIAYEDQTIDFSFDQGATWTNSQTQAFDRFVTTYLVPTQLFARPTFTFETILG